MTKALALTIYCKSHRKQKRKTLTLQTSQCMYWSDTVQTASLANCQIASDCGGQHWTVSSTNLNALWSWKTAHHWKKGTLMIITLNSTLLTIKINTSSLRSQWLLSLSRYSPEFHATSGSLHGSRECHSTLSQSMISQNPSWYNSLKSSHIHTGHLNGLFPFPIKKICSI